MMLAVEDALHSEFDAYEDCFDDQTAAVPLDLPDVKDRLATRGTKRSAAVAA
jgi:hypothetical protein